MCAQGTRSGIDSTHIIEGVVVKGKQETMPRQIISQKQIAALPSNSVADALKYIPAPVEEIANVPLEQTVVSTQPKVEPVKAQKVENKVAQPKVQVQQQVPVQTQVKPAVKGGSNIATATMVKEKAQPKQNPILAQAKQQKTDDQLLNDMYMQETRFDVKPSLWQRIKNSKLVRTIKYVMSIRVVLEFPALPEGRGENNL